MENEYIYEEAGRKILQDTQGAPILLIGVGGVGGRIVAQVDRMLAADSPRRNKVAIVAIDTNVKDLRKLRDQGIETIQISDERLVRQYLKDHPQYMSWFPSNIFLNNRGMLEGAGQIRAISRLAALAAEEEGKFLPIENAVRRIAAITGSGLKENVLTMVVGSVCGGTGAGMFIQIPFYVKRVIQKILAIPNVMVRGMFLGPDIMAPIQPGELNRQAVYVNAYACLKELNAFYMLQRRDAADSLLRMEYYDYGENEDLEAEVMESRAMYQNYARDMASQGASMEDEIPDDIQEEYLKRNGTIPYDHLFLFDSSFNGGTIGQKQLAEVEKMVAGMAYVHLLTDVGENALSVEDNFILSTIGSNGMSRYGSAGLCKLIYPGDQVMQYCSLRWLTELVDRYWLRIDHQFEEELSMAREEQNLNPRVVLPNIQERYQELFLEETRGEHAGLSALYSQVFMETEDGGEISLAGQFLEAMEQEIEDAIGGDSLQKMAESCLDISIEQWAQSPEAARQGVATNKQSIRNYRAAVMKVMEDNKYSLPNQFIPATLSAMISVSDREACISSILGRVHPIAARYLLYVILENIRARRKEAEEDCYGLELDLVSSADYDISGDNPNAPIEAVLGKRMRRRELKRVLEVYEDAAGRTVSNLTAYASCGLRAKIYLTLEKRLEKLCDLYQRFFRILEGATEDIRRQVKELRSMEKQSSVGEQYVCCSEDCLDVLYFRFALQCQSSSSALPQESSRAILRCIYGEMEQQLKQTGMAQRKKEEYAYHNRMLQIFRQAVVLVMQEKAKEEASSLIAMNIYDALALEMETIVGVSRENNREAYDYHLDNWIKNKVARAMTMAQPWIGICNIVGKTTMSVYLAMHPDNAVKMDGTASVEATAQRFLKDTATPDGHAVTVLIHDNFRADELICYKARYNLLIENLDKFKRGGEAHRHYEERMIQIGKMPRTSQEADVITVINPHLNKFWCEEAYLPSIYPSQRAVDEKNNIRAFFYSLTLDKPCCVRLKNKKGNISWWFLHGMETIRVKAAGIPIGNSYADLYESMKFNREMKYTLLYDGRNHLRRTKALSSPDTMEEEIYRQTMIADMIQQEKEPDDENMLDILEKMSRGMETGAFNNLLRGFGVFIREYCEFMFDRDEVKTLYACRNIRNAIVSFSRLYQKRKNETLTYREETLLRNFLDLYEEEELINSNAGLTRVLYGEDEEAEAAAAAADEPGERVLYTGDYDDLA
ncbi:MAG: hypothetical protein IJ468_02100 [Lachnospiraceae bacterium]|nr:hypothetical protein [Lachnospiraceae bacterium]